MSMRPWHVVTGWGIGNLVLVGVLFAFHESLLAELLYLLAGVPLAIFATAVWYSDHISHTGVRSLGGSAVTALPFAFGCAVIGVGVIFSVWIAVVGIIIALVTGGQLLRAAPTRLHAAPEELVRLPVRTLTSPPSFTTAALEKDDADEDESDSGGEKPAASGRHRGEHATVPAVALVAAAGMWVREVVRARRRGTSQ
jgi:hypothetical protein